MKAIQQFNNTHVLVLGLAVSGYSATNLLLKLGAKVTVNDFKNLDDDDQANELKSRGVTVVSGSHPLELLDQQVDYIVKNPGIPYSNSLLREAIKRSIPIYTEIELAYLVSESPIVAITGTNGKTTTTKMIEAVLDAERSSGQVYAVGNIGTPASLLAQTSTSEDDIVMEVSSFQLMGTEQFKPHIAIILNIYSAHLDYHKTRDEYVKAKLAITKNQTEADVLIYNADQSELSDWVMNNSKAKRLPFSRKKQLETGVYLKNNTIVFNGETVMKVADVTIPGEHNLENALAAIAVAKLKGVTNETIRKVFNQFKGVPHRMQYVDQVYGRDIYNDSKATNTLATVHALKGFNKPLVLIAGGLDRGETFQDLMPVLSERVKGLVTFGESAAKLAEVAKQAGVNQVVEVKTVREATQAAFQLSEEGDTILLSPACASWDQYDNFELRGNDFLEQIERIKQEN